MWYINIGENMKRIKINKKSIIISIILIIFVIGCIFTYNFVMKKINGDISLLKLDINGDKEIILKYNEEYVDLGATAKYDNNDLTSTIEVDNNLDIKKIGTYKYTYKVKYKRIEKEVERTIKVVDEQAPVIKLNGRDDYSIGLGGKYVEYGASATDEYDGDLSSKIIIDSTSVDTNKAGNYKILYSVEDSSGNKTEVERIVKVSEGKAEKIAVLNYHFFYEDKSENCNQSICLDMDKFREQLQYLKENDFYTLTIQEFVSWMYGEIELPAKSVLLTIDDGNFGTSKINGNHLIPALEQYKMHATLFLITGWWSIGDYESQYLDVQSHSHDLHREYRKYCEHRSKVNCVPYEELLNDLKESINVVKDTSSFCFPFYEYTDTSLKAVKEVGFKTAFIGGFRKAKRSDDKYKIPRYPIYDNTSLKTFISYVN